LGDWAPERSMKNPARFSRALVKYSNNSAIITAFSYSSVFYTQCFT
jgi:hypothetical protein